MGGFVIVGFCLIGLCRRGFIVGCLDSRLTCQTAQRRPAKSNRFDARPNWYN